jgi:hypothetical protein
MMSLSRISLTSLDLDSISSTEAKLGATQTSSLEFFLQAAEDSLATVLLLAGRKT